jgi:hypothetical protein
MMIVNGLDVSQLQGGTMYGTQMALGHFNDAELAVNIKRTPFS